MAEGSAVQPAAAGTPPGPAHGSGPDPGTGPGTDSEPGLWSSLTLGALIAGLGMSMLADIAAAQAASPFPTSIPVLYALVTVLLTVSGLGVFGSGVIALARRGSDPEFRLPPRIRLAKAGALIAALAAFPVLLPIAGFPASMAVLYSGAGLVYAPRRWAVVVPTGVLIGLALHVVGTQLLGVDLSWATE